METVMSRRLACLAFLAGAALAAPALAQDAYTTRIEPRAYYGASVTIESGVRVFRALPPTRHVIVNPGGQTPLNLGYYDTRVVEHSQSYNYNYNYDRGGDYGVGGFVGDYGYGRRGHLNRGHHHGRAGRGFSPSYPHH
jgi:hypothetical protein